MAAGRRLRGTVARRLTQSVGFRDVFVDTGGWIAVLHEGDSYHQRARPVYERLLRENVLLVTTNLVLAETYLALRRGAGAARALMFLDALHASPRIHLVFATSGHHAAARTILEQYQDQDFSYTDAVSFAVMKERSLRAALAFDTHFLVAGFELLAGLRG